MPKYEIHYRWLVPAMGIATVEASTDAEAEGKAHDIWKEDGHRCNPAIIDTYELDQECRYDAAITLIERHLTDGSTEFIDECIELECMSERETWRALLAEAIAYEQEFFERPEDEDGHISGADVIDWFTGFRRRVKQTLGETKPSQPAQIAES